MNQKPDELLLITGITQAQKIKLARITTGLRQIDLASRASVQPIEVVRAEKGRYVLPTHCQRILRALGLDDDET
jgi:hypothetical protein